MRGRVRVHGTVGRTVWWVWIVIWWWHAMAWSITWIGHVSSSSNRRRAKLGRRRFLFLVLMAFFFLVLMASFRAWFLCWRRLRNVCS